MIPKRDFENAVICEAFCQQIEQIPFGEETCIVVSGDELLRTAVGERLGVTASVKVVRNLEELKNEINFLELFYSRDWRATSIEQFIEVVNSYIRWYNAKRIKVSLGSLRPLEYRESLGLAA